MYINFYQIPKEEYMIKKLTMADIIEKWEEQSRQTGRTTDIIYNLPVNENFIICVHKQAMGDAIRKKVIDMYGPNVQGRMEIKSVKGFNDVKECLKRCKNTFIDNATLYSLNKQIFEELDNTTE